LALSSASLGLATRYSDSPHHNKSIPYRDDWAMFRDDRPATLSIPWLFDSANMRPSPTEHIIATTKLFVWMQYHLNGWNNRINLVLNFLIYGLFLGGMGWFTHQAVPTLPAYVRWAFMIFLLSPINWFNHFMATQSCFRFYLIFFLLGSYVLFSKSQRWSHILVGSLLSTLSIYSLASGFGSCLILLIAFCTFKGARIYSKSSAAHRIHEIFQLAVAAFLIGGALLFWLAQVERPSRYGLPILPHDLRFWRFFLNLVSFGFGMERLSSGWGAFCLLVVLIPICAMAWKRQGNLTNIQWVCFVMVAGILVNVAEVAIGRAGFGVEPKAIRYVEFVLPLMLLSMSSWAMLLRHHKRVQGVTLAGLFVFCLITFSNNWSFDVYPTEASNRAEGRMCVKAYYKGVGDGHCPTIYGEGADRFPLPTWLEGARKVKASFYNDIQEEIEMGK
jgi:hypothetical protein